LGDERTGSPFEGIGKGMLISGIHERIGRRGRRTDNTCIEDCRLVRGTVVRGTVVRGTVVRGTVVRGTVAVCRVPLFFLL
jgi:hypothetical protein